jgi:hypothetical protein
MGVMLARTVTAFSPGTATAVKPVARFAPPGGRIPARIGFEQAFGRHTHGFCLVQPIPPNTAFLQDLAELPREFAALGSGLPDPVGPGRRLRPAVLLESLRQLDGITGLSNIRSPFTRRQGRAHWGATQEKAGKKTGNEKFAG